MKAERAPVHSFDARDPKVYEGCMPIEVLASRGHDAIRFGPMKPVGLRDPARATGLGSAAAAHREPGAHLVQPGGVSDQLKVWGAAPGVRA